MDEEFESELYEIANKESQAFEAEHKAVKTNQYDRMKYDAQQIEELMYRSDDRGFGQGLAQTQAMLLQARVLIDIAENLNSYIRVITNHSI